MNELIIDIVGRGGYLGIAILMALENIFPPIPSEVVMGIGGILVARGEMAFWPLLIVGTLGTTAGNYAWYWAGNRLGYRRLEPFVNRWGRWLTLDWEHIEQAARFFQRHGQWVVFFLRFSPFLRTIVSLPAGLAHMPVGRFLVFTFLGAGVWNALLILGGSLLEPLLEEYDVWATGIIIAFIIGGIGYYIYRVVTWTPRHLRQPPDEPHD